MATDKYNLKNIKRSKYYQDLDLPAREKIDELIRQREKIKAEHEAFLEAHSHVINKKGSK